MSVGNRRWLQRRQLLANLSCPSGGLILRPFQQSRQLRNIARDPAGLVAREQSGR
jgi:hypothetical protein